jgi:hypothetical protein
MMKSQSTNRTTSSLYPMLAIIVVSWLGVPSRGLGQPAGCTLVPDDRHPAEEILRCGDSLTIHSAANTKYQVTGQTNQGPPAAARLESGALLIEFTPSDRRKNFQILTPHAIAAVRGTRWAVEVEPSRTSTLVLSGTVEVMRPRGKQRGALLHPGEGADVSTRAGPIVVKRWAKKRVDALLARLGQ